jgi:hypothetical protein
MLYAWRYYMLAKLILCGTVITASCSRSDHSCACIRSTLKCARIRYSYHLQLIPWDAVLGSMHPPTSPLAAPLAAPLHHRTPSHTAAHRTYPSRAPHHHGYFVRVT